MSFSSPHILRHLPLALCLALPALTAIAGNDAIIAVGEPSAPAPTFNHLSLEWPIDGDGNFDSVVQVRFRVDGTDHWRHGMPLRRVPAGSNGSFSWSNRHAGSLFGLQADTLYEIELELFDPDGGAATRGLGVHTRRVPVSYAPGPVRQATPATLAGILASVQPGDTVLLGAGNYSGFSLGRDGTADRPITLRGSADAQISGELGLFFRRHWLLENLKVSGRIRLNGSEDIGVHDSTITASASQYDGHGIVCFLRCERLHIAGNTILGTTQWNEAALGVNGNNRGEGIVVTGPGHVIERNVVTGFRDGISFMEGAEAIDQYSIDVLENHIDLAADDAIEADFCAHNCRIIGNRVINAFVAFSSQPSLGGPNYFLRNSAYNVVHVAFKLHNGSSGDVLLHNTVVKNGDAFAAYPNVGIHRLYTRNNLFLGGAGGSWGGYSSGSGRVIDLATLVTTGSSLNYNGYGSESGFSGRLGSVLFTSLAQLQAQTSEQNTREIARSDTFQSPVPYPNDPMQRTGWIDLTLATGSPAIDAGEVIANINDDFNGDGPDLGAFERAQASDHIFGDGFEVPARSVRVRR